MESKKLIRIGMKLSQAIIEILTEELDNDEKKGKGRDEKKERNVKRNRKDSR